MRGFFSKDFIIEKLMETTGELYLVILLLVFLRVSVYYAIKLLRLFNITYSYSMVEKRYLGIGRALVMIMVMMGVINVFVRFMVRLRLEVLSFKMIIYMFIFIFLLLSVITNLNYKFNVYDKVKNFQEV